MAQPHELIRKLALEKIGAPDLPWDEGLRSLELNTLYFANEKNAKPGANFAKTFDLLQHASDPSHPYMLVFVFDRPYRHLTILPYPDGGNRPNPRTTGETKEVTSVTLAHEIGAMAHKDRMMYTQGSVFVAQSAPRDCSGEFTVGHYAHDDTVLNGWIAAVQQEFAAEQLSIPDRN